MSNRVKISEIAKEAGRNNRDIITKAQELGIDASRHYDTVSESDAGKIFDAITKSTSSQKPKRDEQKSATNNTKRDNSRSTEKPQQKREKEESQNRENQSSQNTEEPQKRSQAPKEEKREERPKPAPKQKGLRIIKKRRPLSRASSTMATGEYGKLSEEARKELNSKKGSSNKKSTSTVARKKNVGEELNIFDRDFKDDRYSSRHQEEEESHEIVLLDYRDQSLFLDEDDKKEDEADKQNKKKGKAKKPAGRNSKSTKNNRDVLVKRSRKKKKKIKREDDEVVTTAEVPENIRVYEFAELIKRPLADVIKVLFNLGMMVTKNDFLDGEVIEILAEEFEIEVTTVDITEEFDYVKDYEDIEESDDDLIERAPVITIMGHVDHGKTSLLDKIRSAKVASGEAGGITQHIGAYTIEHNDRPITFIDTPGHSAFSEMRKRGAKITDIVIIVVAADDGVKPQTKEAIKHAQEAGVPIIVAMNKMDKEGANPDMVKAQVSETGLTPIDWGGDIEFIPVSAKSGDGVDELLETILVQSEVLELQANPDRHAKAVVIESSLEKGRGAVATVIVQNGTLSIGDSIVVGSHYGKVKSLLDDKKKPIKSIAPGETGVVVGLSGVPASGDDLVATDSEKEARELAEKRRQYERNQALSKTTKASLDELSSMIAEGRLNVLKVILKTDVHGTLEAIKSSLEELRNDEVKISIISEGVGGITENDVILAGDSENIVIVGFNVRPTGAVKTLADKKGVKLKTYSVIYEIIDDMTNILTGMMKPIEEQRNTGQAEIKQLFKVKEGTVAGCMVIDGVVEKGIFARLIRNGVILGDTTVHSLKRFKDEVNEVKKGYECGILLKDIDNIAEGDIIETYEKIEKEATL
jgi:translation initiation factor IF-2